MGVGTARSAARNPPHRRFGASVLIAPVLLGVAVVPWTHDGDPWMKLVFSLCMLLLSIGLWRLGWRRTSYIRTDLARSDSDLEPAFIEQLTLTGHREVWSADATTGYEVLVRRRGQDNDDLMLSRASRPLAALTPLITLGQLENARIVSSWGLDREALVALLGNASARSPVPQAAGTQAPDLDSRAANRLQADVHPAQQAVARALLFGSLFVVTVTGVVFVRRLEQGFTISWLSWLMPSIASSLALSFAAITKFNHCVFYSGNKLLIERRVLGLTLTRHQLDPDNLLGAWGVSPDGGAPLHLLIATRSGPIEVRCCGQGALRIVDALRSSLRLATE